MQQQVAQSAAPSLYPFLRYKDARAALEWLSDAFGFESQVVVAGSRGSVAHARMKLGTGVIMLGSEREDDLRMRSPVDLPAVPQGIYVYLENVERHYHRARAAGAEIVRELEETDYGSREYTARDLEGHLWSFGSYRP